jgi:hypothetical protein
MPTRKNRFPISGQFFAVTHVMPFVVQLLPWSRMIASVFLPPLPALRRAEEEAHQVRGEPLHDLPGLRLRVRDEVVDPDRQPLLVLGSDETEKAIALLRHLQPGLSGPADPTAPEGDAPTTDLALDLAAAVGAVGAGDLLALLLEPHRAERAEPDAREVGRLPLLGLRVLLPAAPGAPAAPAVPLPGEGSPALRELELSAAASAAAAPGDLELPPGGLPLDAAALPVGALDARALLAEDHAATTPHESERFRRGRALATRRFVPAVGDRSG